MNDKDKEAFDKWVALLDWSFCSPAIKPSVIIDMKKGWQSACEYKQKEIDELENKIYDLEDDMKDFCNLIDYVFHFAEEGKDFFWLGDNIHSAYSSEQATIKKAREALEKIRGKE